MIMAMADTLAAPAETLAADPDPVSDEPGGVNWGRVLDAAGIAAGILLVLIVADVWTEGRFISRRLIRQPPAPDGEQVSGER
jgi:hypothetical protein